MQTPNENQLWCPGQSLWSLIVEHVHESELDKIHTALGLSLIDMYTEVHTEAEMWHKMWQASHQENNWSRAGTPLPRQQACPLADPPAVKELVRAEVKMLLQTLKERVSGEGRGGEELLFRYKPETVDYAMSHPDSCYRNCTNPGDTDNGSRPSSHCSVQSNAEDEIEAMRDKVNVTDIDQVVERLRCVLTEECVALKRLVKHFKENIKQKCQSQHESDKSEPSLAELRELRGAIQMDLERYPSPLPASVSVSSSLHLKELKSRFRLSAGQKVSDETLRALSTTSALRPHPPPPLCHTKPRPPLSAPPSKTSTSVKLINSSSLLRTHGQHRSISASTGPRKIQTPVGNRITTPGHALLPGPGSDQMMVKSIRDPSLCPEQDSADIHCRTTTYSPSPRNVPIHETHLSSHRSIHSPGRKFDLSPQTERKSSPAWRLRNTNTIPSSRHCDAGSYSSNSTHHSVSTTVQSKTQNGRQNSSCESSLLSTTVQTDIDKRKSTFESFHACVGSRKSNSGIDGDEQQSLVAARTHPASIRINGQFFTSHKRPLEGTSSRPKDVQETQTELELIKFYQPVPPARVST
ncbi:hypothetical protein ABVT39_000257 [Epinephelus coioides]